MGPSGPRSLAARGWIIATVGADTVREGTVWIAEDHDGADSLLLTGRFSGYLERDGRLKDRFEDLEAEDAIAWGRARAAKVLIRTGDSGCYFSAGERNSDPHEYPEWSTAGLRLERRRPRGFEALDNTESDPPTLWDVRISADLPNQGSASPFHERVRSDPAVRNAEAPAPGYPAASAAFLVEASTLSQAQAMANRILSDALATLAEALPATESYGFVAEAEVYPHRPGKPVSGPGITY
jgi:hypothetical protein